MDPEFWHDRWALGEIGFHRSSVHPALPSHWDSLARSSNDPVLVPLCGKSLDMHWLAGQGHPTFGVELDATAVDAFFEEWPTIGPVMPETSLGADGLARKRFDQIELVCGDFQRYKPTQCFSAFYDRAALIALPPAMRPAYLKQLRACLCVGAQGLLVTFEYVQNQMDGPPFSIVFSELEGTEGLAFEPLSSADVLDRHPGMRAKGLSRLVESIYRVTAQ